jgi:hypothetical protein
MKTTISELRLWVSELQKKRTKKINALYQKQKSPDYRFMYV